MAFPMAATMETAMNGYRDSGRYVFTDDDFTPSIATNRPETIKLERPNAEGIENFRLSSSHVASLKQTLGCDGDIPVWKILVLCVQTPLNVRGQSQERNTLNLMDTTK
jgi:hypothetical protein